MIVGRAVDVKRVGPDAGRFARVFVGLGPGWTADRGGVPTADDLGSHIDDASATEPFIVPASIFDEVA